MRRREFITLFGAAAGWPSIARAQQPAKARRIAIVHPSVPAEKLTDPAVNPNVAAFVAELQRLGHSEGANFVIDRHSGGGDSQRFPEVAREVVRRGPDVIFAVALLMAQPLKAATQTIPIVTITSDPVATGLVASLARPGGNVTGVVIDAGIEVWEKRFELLRELVPTISDVAFPLSPDWWESPYGRAVRAGAQRAGITLVLAELRGPFQETEIRRMFAALREQRVHALAISDAPGPLAHRKLIVQLVEELRLPAVYPFREFVEVGGLAAYAVETRSLMRHAARQVDQILKGGKPGEIPFYQATRFEVVINLKAAKALELTISPTLLVRADEVIE